MGREAITLNIDDLTDGYSSLSIGRHLARASILGGVTAAVFSPLYLYLFGEILFERMRGARSLPETSSNGIFLPLPSSFISCLSSTWSLHVCTNVQRQ
jgi:hypothetical protein